VLRVLARSTGAVTSSPVGPVRVTGGESNSDPRAAVRELGAWERHVVDSASGAILGNVAHVSVPRRKADWLSNMRGRRVLEYGADLARLGGYRGLKILVGPLEWLARLADHIPDSGRHRTRFYAQYANRVRGERPDEQEQRHADEAQPPTRRRSSLAWARLIAKVFQADPLVCRRCGGLLNLLLTFDRSRRIVHADVR